MIVNMAPGHISHALRLPRGPNWSPVSACATGAHAIGEALAAHPLRRDRRDDRRRHARRAITPLGIGGFNADEGAVRRATTTPERASRPFDKDRDGFVIGEGAGIVVLEELEHARSARRAIHAELVGYGANADAYHVTAPAPEGEGAARVHARWRSQDAGLNPERGRLHQRPRHLHADQRRERDARPSRRSSASTRASWRSARPSR